MATEEIRRLQRRLQANSKENTVQSHQLIKAKAEIDDARDRYAELYDFAPLGYVLLDERGVIHESNLAAATLFSRPRRSLVNVPLSTLLVSRHRATLRAFLNQAAHRIDGASAVNVQLATEPPRIIRLFAKARPGRRGTRMLFTALMDVTVEHDIETERRAALVREQGRARELADEVADRTLAETRVKTLLDRLVIVQEEERRRLSRELHDELGQQLTALRLTLSVLRQMAGNQKTRRQLDIADGIAERLDHDVDHLAWALRPLDESGLLASLDTFVRRWSETHRIPATLKVAKAVPQLPKGIANDLYRVVQEALNNIVKHAQATHAEIRVAYSRGRIRLTIHDNGHGYDAVTLPNTSGIGLLGMQERIALLGGSIDVTSNASRGTTISIVMPLSSSAT